MTIKNMKKKNKTELIEELHFEKHLVEQIDKEYNEHIDNIIKNWWEKRKEKKIKNDNFNMYDYLTERPSSDRLPDV